MTPHASGPSKCTGCYKLAQRMAVLETELILLQAKRKDINLDDTLPMSLTGKLTQP
ncbi:hypothetical protein AAFF_G00014240, partial [Aldrovandia affinis]